VKLSLIFVSQDMATGSVYYLWRILVSVVSIHISTHVKRVLQTRLEGD
jgi:hypothetical protein